MCQSPNASQSQLHIGLLILDGCRDKPSRSEHVEDEGQRYAVRRERRENLGSLRKMLHTRLWSS